MPAINPATVPFVSPGEMFNRLVTDPTFAVRWLSPLEPAYYEVLNRQGADIVLRQLVIAKALDRINQNVGYLSQFPFIVQPQVQNGSTIANVPVRIFWDMHISMPDKWSNVRLARVDRVNGANGTGGDTGTVRFIFTGNERTDGTDSAVETALFYLDYKIDSALTYQDARPHPADVTSGISGFSANLAIGEAPTVGGSVVFHTQDSTTADMQSFLQVAAPGGTNEAYQILDTTGGGTDAFSPSGLSHGTGLLTSSAYNGIVSLESDPLNWIEAFNFPFSLVGTRISLDSAITIPAGLFQEFSITAPANDAPSTTNDGTHYPVWISSLTRNGSDYIFSFSTFNITDSAPNPSVPVIFAKLTLQRNMVGGQLVDIEPLNNLVLRTGSNTDLGLATQHFGRGHVVLSRKWDTTGGEVDDFCNQLPEVPSGTNTVTFASSATRISAFACTRTPKYTPTKGENQALRGTTARKTSPLHPSDSNRYVTEGDEGLGDAINLDASSGIVPDPAISPVGHMATRCHPLIKLVVDQSRVTEDAAYYDNAILPRLTILFGRAPRFGDEWYTGTRFMRYNGDSWVG